MVYIVYGNQVLVAYPCTQHKPVFLKRVVLPYIGARSKALVREWDSPKTRRPPPQLPKLTGKLAVAAGDARSGYLGAIQGISSCGTHQNPLVGSLSFEVII